MILVSAKRKTKMSTELQTYDSNLSANQYARLYIQI